RLPAPSRARAGHRGRQGHSRRARARRLSRTCTRSVLVTERRCDWHLSLALLPDRRDVLMPMVRPRTALDRGAVGWGIAAVAVALVLVGFGSGGLRWFDAALVGYLFGTLFAIFGTVY